MKNFFKVLMFAGMAFASISAAAQVRYQFKATDYVSTDNSRAPQRAFSYDANANSFTIKANGKNNIAFKMNNSLDGQYYITPRQTLYVIEASDVESGKDGCLVWWFNGSNESGSVAADKVYTTKRGTTVFVWDIRKHPVMNSGIGGSGNSQRKIRITAGGRELINAQGLTSKAGQSAVLRVDYLEPYGFALAYPEFWKQMGVSAKSLATEIGTAMEESIAKAESLLEDGESKTLSDALSKAQAERKRLSQKNLSQAYAELHRLEDALTTSRVKMPVLKAEAMENGVHVEQKGLHTYVMFYTGDIVRVLKSPKTLDEIDKLSMSVIRKPQSVRTSFEKKENNYIVKGGNISISIDVADGHITASRQDGTGIIAEQEAGTSFVAKKDGPYDSYTIRNTFRLDPDEYVFGLGQIQHGNLNQRGMTLDLEQWNMRVCIPYFLSTKHYALFWDNYSPSTYSDTGDETFFESTGTEIDYYILAGKSSSDVISHVRWLTGDATMPPLWNFGLYQSKERYKSADETRDVVRRYRELGVPLDCVVQDWQYWGDNDYWNALEFRNPTFANYQEMIDDVHKNNAHLLLSIWANFGPNSKPFKELDKLGRLIPVTSYPADGLVHPYDVWSDTARDIYWRYLYNNLVKKGIDAYWIDSTEPDYTRRSDSEMDYVSENGRTWRTMRNSFVLGHVSGIYNHHRDAQQTDDALAKKRVSILTRSGFIGQQRYAAQTWSGDITASWQTLARQIPAALNFSACGIPYWNNDNGAFFLGSYGGCFNDQNFCRLYLRWTQFSTFTGMMRFHGSGYNSEIWQLGKAGDPDYDQVLKYIRIRYRLLPYLYSTAWQICHNQQSLMTALPLAFTDDRKAWDMKYEYMFGQSLLVCPVVEDNKTLHDIYLPAGQQWYDFWTGETHRGGQTIVKRAPLDIIPLYVKAGSILPWGPDVQYSTEKPWDNLELRVYAGADGQFILYEDENDSYNYERGLYTEIPIRWDNTARTLTFGRRTGEFPGMMQHRTFNVVLVNGKEGVGDQPSSNFTATITYDGTEQIVKL